MINSTFNKLRFMAEIGLPSLAAFLTAVGTIWSLPVMIPVVSTIIALNTLTGALVSLERLNYNQVEAAK